MQPLLTIHYPIVSDGNGQVTQGDTGSGFSPPDRVQLVFHTRRQAPTWQSSEGSLRPLGSHKLQVCIKELYLEDP